MAGHSHGKTVLPRKNKVNAEKAKIFTILSKKINIALREGGEDLQTNFRLRQLVMDAKKHNMPKDNITRALNSLKNKDENYYSLTYEGYLSDGVAVIIDVLTNNKNRVSSELKSIFSRNGGNFGVNVRFLFENIGMISSESIDIDSITDFLLSSSLHGVIDITENDGNLEIYSEIDELVNIKNALEENFDQEFDDKIIWKAIELIEINEEKASEISLFLNKISNLDDVENVFVNIV